MGLVILQDQGVDECTGGLHVLGWNGLWVLHFSTGIPNWSEVCFLRDDFGDDSCSFILVHHCRCLVQYKTSEYHLILAKNCALTNMSR